ncbi:cytochrome b [Chelatococcus sambhunathii]|uniref:Cytochrome b n=1 Tax=Chelatococcus sambhunathii TaxID=363953 RepID=A0ABU1DBL3_9HYPH|nr:cytochrome b [Chelatococcus sambhunathii]MDR4305462.1 cytochrome b [Chelatococcus sambhunathii]
MSISTNAADGPLPASGGYSATAKAFHWTVAVLVIVLIAVGVGREFMPKGPEKDLVTMLHKATGIVVLGLMLARLAYRIGHRPPPPEPGQPVWKIGLSHAVHWALYLIVIVMPILGWLGSNALGRPVSMYGLFDLPTLIGENKDLGETIYDIHGLLGFTALGLIVVHAGAALHHHFVLRDAVLKRMT